MQAYGNLSGDSGVIAYELDDGAITVQFEDGYYLYSNASAGTDNIVQMQRLARSGQGLSSYISRFVRDRYARKWH